MNKIILAVMMLLICVACSNNSSTKNRESQENPVVQADHVEVLYFHGKQRCPTCLAIEKNTKAVIENKNLTKDAFAKARTTPESFKEELAKKIKQLLN